MLVFGYLPAKLHYTLIRRFVHPFELIDLFIDPFAQRTHLFILIMVPFHLTFTYPEAIPKPFDLPLLGAKIPADIGNIHRARLFSDHSLEFLDFALQFLDIALHRLDLSLKLLGVGEIFDILIKLLFCLPELSLLSAEVRFNDLGSTDALDEPEHIESVLIDLQDHPALRREECDLLCVAPFAILIKECAVVRLSCLHYVVYTPQIAHIPVIKLDAAGIIIVIQSVSEYSLVITGKTLYSPQQTRFSFGVRRSDAIDPFPDIERVDTCKSTYILQFQFHHITLAIISHKGRVQPVLYAPQSSSFASVRSAERPVS